MALLYCAAPRCDAVSDVLCVAQPRRTHFYSAVKRAVELLKGPDHESECKWIVALTDGADTCDAELRERDKEAAMAGLRDTDDLNLAVITLGEEVNRPEHLTGIEHLVASATKGGREPDAGIRVGANDLQQVEEAFRKIAEQMVAPSGGAMG